MADTIIPYAQPGVAAFEMSDEFRNSVLLRGEHPKLSPAISAKAGANISRFQVVGFNANGDIVPATALIKPIGVAYTAALANERVLYWYTGHFNSDMLVWDAAFADQADRDTAFDGAPTPVNIRISKRFA